MKKTQKRALAVGAGVAALAAAAAGTYLLAGKRGAKNRAKVKAWVKDVQKDVVSQLKKAKGVSKKAYNEAVDTALAGYKNLKNVDKSELLAAGRELKSHWDSISKQLTGAPKKRRTTKAAKPALRRKTA